MNKQREKVFLTFLAPTGGARKKKKITRKLLSKLDPSYHHLFSNEVCCICIKNVFSGGIKIFQRLYSLLEI